MPQTPLLYTVVKHWVRLGMSAYFKRYAITGLQHVPTSDPIILAANHQNAFLDALAIAAHLNRPVHFMTRADVFAKPWVAKFFQNLNMLPIYRRRDGVDTIEMNKPIFEATAHILNQNGAVVIFPEANQERKHILRPLHKGFARMAFGAAEQNQFSADVKIVPVGINYSHHLKARTNLLVQFAPPLSLADYVPLYKETPQKALKKLTDDLAPRITPLMIHIPNGHDHATIDYLRTLYEPVLRLKHKQPDNLPKNYHRQQLIVDALQKLALHNPDVMEELAQHTQAFKQQNKTRSLTPDTLAKPPAGIIETALYCMLIPVLLPLFVVGWLHHVPLMKLICFTLHKKVKDLNFMASVKFLAALVVFTLFYPLVSLLAGWLSGVWWVAPAYLAIAPLSGKIALFYEETLWHQCKQQLAYWRVIAKPNAALLKHYRHICTLLHNLLP